MPRISLQEDTFIVSGLRESSNPNEELDRFLCILIGSGNITKALVPDHLNHNIIITNTMGGFHLGEVSTLTVSTGELREY